MRYGLEEIVNLLHNNTPAEAARILRRQADNPAHSLQIMAQVLEVQQRHATELAAGVPFMALFARHAAGSQGPPRGLGDTIAQITRATKLDRLAHLYTRVTGKDCGCKRRQTKLNNIFPYRR